jgi:hypothetical protein
LQKKRAGTGGEPKLCQQCNKKKPKARVTLDTGEILLLCKPCTADREAKSAAAAKNAAVPGKSIDLIRNLFFFKLFNLFVISKIFVFHLFFFHFAIQLRH